MLDFGEIHYIHMLSLPILGLVHGDTNRHVHYIVNPGDWKDSTTTADKSTGLSGYELARMEHLESRRFVRKGAPHELIAPDFREIWRQ